MRIAFAALCFLCVAGQVDSQSRPRGVVHSGDKLHVTPDGDPIQLDLPASLHMRNTGGSDGAGLCVFTSINHSAYWQNVKPLYGFQQYMRSYPGGGYPDKVRAKIKDLCGRQSVPEPEYLNLTGGKELLDILRLACKTGRMPAITYSYSPAGRYGGRWIAHMVTLVHVGPAKDGQEAWYGMLDNNMPGTIEWCRESEFYRVLTGGGRSGWTVILLNPGPPPVPRN